MAQAKLGDRVKVHYTGKFVDGTVFDSSNEREPMEFTIGGMQVIPGFEQAVLGMAPGDSKTEKVACEDAYGLRRDDMIVEVERQYIPKEINPEVGQLLEMQRSDGQTIPVRVTEVSENTITLDANHPLAGKDLVFEIMLVEIVG
ncbi:MAG: peptidylprolyl isomerase [bacterium]|jgi:peptidylprolyl isomerase